MKKVILKFVDFLDKMIKVTLYIIVADKNTNTRVIVKMMKAMKIIKKNI